MAYIANRPVRFDRDYAIGEVIPDSVIDPTMTRKLVAMGRIICADIPTGNGAGDDPETAENGAGSPVEGGNGAEGTNTQGTPQDAPEGESDGTEGIPDGEGTEEVEAEPETTEDGAGNEGETESFICPVCGKAFSSSNGLAAHSRVHKE